MAVKAVCRTYVALYFFMTRNEEKFTDISSAFLGRCESFLRVEVGLALDLPCGTLRNVSLLVTFGYRIIGADFDEKQFHRSEDADLVQRIETVVLDGFKALPFPTKHFDLIAVIHPPSHLIAVNAAPYVKSGGYMVIETFEDRGGNWKALPRPTEVQGYFASGWKSLIYIEKLSRQSSQAVTVKALFRRI